MEHIEVPPHVQRMRQEREELEIKLRALQKFIKGNPVFKTLDPEERTDMVVQADIMEGYLSILTQRLERALRKI